MRQVELHKRLDEARAKLPNWEKLWAEQSERAEAAEKERDAARTDIERCQEVLATSAKELIDMRARLAEVERELQEYREAALYDACMDGPKFKGWNRSQLDRARKLTEIAERSRQEKTTPATKDKEE